MVGVYGLDSHIESHIETSFFLLFENLKEDIFVILLFFTDLFAIFELITILSVDDDARYILPPTHTRPCCGPVKSM